MDKRGIVLLIENILKSTDRAATIVLDMLAFARTGDSLKVLCKIEELLDKTVALAANDFSLKKNYDFRFIKLQKEIAPNLPPIPCEPTKIQQVLLNILKDSAQALIA